MQLNINQLLLLMIHIFLC